VELRERLSGAQLYFICGASPGGRDLAEVLPRALAGGVHIFQLRMKDGGDAELLAASAVARELCDEAGALFILNDRPDLVEATGADGVHVGQDDAAVEQARAILGPDRLIGVSTHEPAQLHKAISDGSDYAGVGPVNETPTKPGRAAVGLEYVRYAAEHAQMPFFAIGGIDTETVGSVMSAGATRFAVVRAIAEASDPQAAARDLLAAAEQGALSGAA
jgi:thiamine-phosphate pyrophosphorylase